MHPSRTAASVCMAVQPAAIQVSRGATPFPFARPLEFVLPFWSPLLVPERMHKHIRMWKGGSICRRLSDRPYFGKVRTRQWGEIKSHRDNEQIRITLTVVATAIVVAALRSRDLRRALVRKMQCFPNRQGSITLACCEYQ